MKKILGIAAAVVTLLTLLTLTIDLPQKLKAAYRGFSNAAPPIKFSALFAHQETITVFPFVDAKAGGFSHFTWPSIYEIHNVTNENVAVADIINILPKIKAGEHLLELQAESDSDRVVSIYNSFQGLNAKGDSGVTERFPVTIKAGEKKYIKVYGTYRIVNNGSPLSCATEEKCYKLLGVSLGVIPKDDGSVPCVLKTFDTRIDFVGFRSETAPQRAVLLIPGCKIDLAPLLDGLKK